MHQKTGPATATILCDWELVLQSYDPSWAQQTQNMPSGSVTAQSVEQIVQKLKSWSSDSGFPLTPCEAEVSRDKTLNSQLVAQWMKWSNGWWGNQYFCCVWSLNTHIKQIKNLSWWCHIECDSCQDISLKITNNDLTMTLEELWRE